MRHFLPAFLALAQDVLIYLVGDSAVHLCFEGVTYVTVQELGRSVRETLHIPDSAQDAFAFWLCSPLLGILHCPAFPLVPPIGWMQKCEDGLFVAFAPAFNARLATAPRAAAEAQTPAIQAVPPVAGPAVPLHRSLGRGHLTGLAPPSLFLHPSALVI